VSKTTTKKTMRSRKACAQTLTSFTVSYRVVKKAIESVHQSISRTTVNRATHSGQDFGVISSVKSCGCEKALSNNSNSGSSHNFLSGSSSSNWVSYF